MIIKYELPRNWIEYRPADIMQELMEAKVAIGTLNNLPFQKEWLTKLQDIELKREIAGTSKIEGAEFTEREFEKAITEDFDALTTRSQKQARAAKLAYDWIAEQPDDYPVNDDTIKSIHELMVRGADDDHCPPGVLRRRDENVTFGIPQHRGVDGDSACDDALSGLSRAISTSFRDHDSIIQAHAAHYHFAAMHPFLDGNGRTARALESMMLQSADLKNSSFIALSKYYYEEKTNYLKVLSETRQAGHDLTGFLKFCLVGLKQVCEKLTEEIRIELSKALFRNTMYDMFNRLVSGKKRVIAGRQIEILNVLLEEERVDSDTFLTRIKPYYGSLKNPFHAFGRDMLGLEKLGTISIDKDGVMQEDDYDPKDVFLEINLNWPSEIDDNEFLRSLKELPVAKSFPFLNTFNR